MHLRRSPIRLWTALAVLVLYAVLAAPLAAKVTVKMATLVPEGSVWDDALRDMGAEWKESTGGEAALRIYAGGVAGDEPDVVRKMRLGQFHAAALTVSGLADIEPGFEIFQIPMFFQSYEELFHVLEKMRPELEKRLAAKGFHLLNWGHGGWVHFFSKEPVRGVADLKKQKVFSWAGDDAMIQLWRANGFQPVALAATDIMTGLQTGMIEALPTTPLAALSLQWYSQTPFMQDIGLAPLVGATVVTDRMWKRLSEGQRRDLRAAATKMEKKLMGEIPDQDARAVTQMKARGLEVVEVSEENRAEWRTAADEFAVFKREEMEAKELLDLARKERDAFRAAEAKP